jgi:hypothetical protein
MDQEPAYLERMIWMIEEHTKEMNKERASLFVKETEEKAEENTEEPPADQQIMTIHFHKYINALT